MVDIRVSGVHAPVNRDNDPDGLYPEEVVVDWAICSEALEHCQSMDE